MSDYTTAEILAAIGDGDDGYTDSGSWYELEDAETIILRGETVAVTHPAQFGGEGQGDDIWFVIGIGDQFFRKSGYYASHYGTDWDGAFEEVRPVEKTVTVYEPTNARR